MARTVRIDDDGVIWDRPKSEWTFWMMAETAGPHLAKTEIFTALDYRVFLFISGNLTYGNRVKVSQAAIAKALGSDPASISRCMSKLVSQKVLSRGDDGYFLNRHIGSKGTRTAKRASEVGLSVIHGEQQQ